MKTKFALLVSVIITSLWPISSPGAGVTIITHGYGGNVSGWIAGMATQITNHTGFPGTNSTTYTITLTTDGSSIFYQWSRVGTVPTDTDSGEIVVKLDWSQMAGGLSAPYDISTYNVAVAASYVLLQTNTISDFGGHALVEFPIHMIGHSRGGSLITKISRILGTNGVWVDDMSKDRVEMNNLSASQPDVVRKMSALWDAWAARCNVIMQKNGQKKNKNLSTVDAAD